MITTAPNETIDQYLEVFNCIQLIEFNVVRLNGSSIDADEQNEPVSDDLYYIVPEKCTECVGFHEEPQCAAVCPVDCCVDDPDIRESEEDLLAKKDKLHI